MSGVLNLLLAGAASAIKDAYFNLTTLLLNTSSTNGAQNNTFLDSSTNNFTITRNGNTTQGTFTPFSQTGWSNYFGSSNYLTTPSSSAFNLSSGDWTIEGWFWLGSNSGDTRLFTVVNSSTDMYGAIVRSGTIRFGQLGVGEAAFGTINLNTWNHIAFSKTSTSTITCYINGASTGTTTSYTLPNANCTVYIAASPANYALATTDGYISNFRIVKGTAVYSGSTITVPTTPLTAITNTSLLTCQSNRFLDNSSNAFAIAANGTPSVQAFSPFAPTAAYNTAVVGGSGYFDGSGDYLTTASNAAFAFGTGDFEVDFWIYATSLPASDSNILNQNLSSGTPQFYIDSTGKLQYRNAFVGAVLTSNTTFKTGQWYYCVISRVSSTSRMFINGTLDTSGSDTTNWSNTAGWYVSNSSGAFTGYISNVRLVKGSGITSSTVPTAPLTAITNTVLLVSATNAGIFDSAAKNDLETVGNAQVSTTQAKWGTTSMKFNGTSDYIVNPSSALVSAWGTGDFTVEGWYYSNSISASISPLWTNSTSNSDGMNILDLSNTGILSFGKVGVNSFSSASGLWSNGNWYHVAVVRSGATIYIYLNGVSIASGAASTYLEASTVKPITLGRNYQSSSVYYDGYIDDFRVTKGYARYPNGTTFTPPTAAFPVQ